MTLSRRGFIGSVVATLSGVTVASKVPDIISTVNAGINPAWDGSFKFSDLNDDYYKCTYGRDEPDLIWVHPKIYAEIMENIQVHYRYMEKREDGLTGLKFNGATIVQDKYMPENKIRMVNSMHPLDPNLNTIIDLV